MKVRIILCVVMMAALAACGAPAATEVAVAPTATAAPATGTSLPPTNTPIPPTVAATEPPPTDTPETSTPVPLPAGWVQRGDMPAPARLGFVTTVVDGRIYVMGGQVGDDGMTTVDVYDPVTDLWTQRASMLYKTVYPGISVVDGRIYVMGGYADLASASSNDLVEEYNPATDTWTEKASMPAPREGLVTAVVGDKIYAIGGAYFTADSPTPEVLAAVAEYDPATDTWTEKAPLPTVVTWAMGGVVDDKIYVIGGATQPLSRILSSIVEYDPVTDTWSEKSPMPAKRLGGAAVVHDGLIYVFGGSDSHGTPASSSVFVYDPAADTWTEGQDMPFERWIMSAEILNGKVYLFGGSTNPYPYTPYLTEVWEYDLAGGVTGTKPTDPIAIRDAYEEAIEAGDVDAALALFADDAVILTPDGPSRGKDEIREILEFESRLVLEGLPFGERLNVESTEDTLDYEERFLAADGKTIQLHHAYVFENGKIKEWTMSDVQILE